MRFLLVLGTVLLSMVAGCLEGSSPASADPPESPTAPVPIASGGPTPTPTPPARDSRRIQLEECYTGGASFIFPLSEGPTPPVPPGWERELRDGWDVFVTVARCERISWGPFERGPLFVLLEFHGKFTAPETCDDGERFQRDVNILHSIWFSDPEVAAYAASEWEMPARFGEFAVESTTEAGVNKTRWSWKNDAGQESFFSLYRFYDNPADEDYIDLLYWFTEDRLYSVNLENESTIDEIQGVLADGEMHPPMLYAESGTNLYPGKGLPYQKWESRGLIQPYGDWECTEPL